MQQGSLAWCGHGSGRHDGVCSVLHVLTVALVVGSANLGQETCGLEETETQIQQ